MPDPYYAFEARPRRLIDAMALSVFRSALDEAVRFSDSEDQVPKDASALLVRTHMSGGFHSTYYVERPEDEAGVVKALQSTRVVAIVGERGSGKSTLIRHVLAKPHAINEAQTRNYVARTEEADIADRSRPTRTVVHIDLSSKIAPTTNKFLQPADVLHVVLERLQQDFFIQTKQQLLNKSWTVFQAKQSLSFQEFRAHATAHDVVLTDDQWYSMSANDRFRRYWERGMHQFLSHAYMQMSVQELLEFFATSHNHTVALIIDNLDHVMSRDQIAVVQALHLILRTSKSGSSCAVAVRTSTLQTLKDVLEPVGGLDEMHVEPYEMLGVSDSLVGQFLRLRLDVIDELLPELEAIAEGLRGGVEVPAGTIDLTELVRRNRRILEVLSRHPLSVASDRSLSSHLRNWYNGSLRLIGSAVQRMLYDAITDSHPTSPYVELDRLLETDPGDAWEEKSEWAKRNRILIRVHLIRKFVFLGDDPNRVPECLPLMKLNRKGPQFKLQYLKLRVLDLLDSKPHDCFILGEILDIFDGFGVTRRPQRTPSSSWENLETPEILD